MDKIYAIFNNSNKLRKKLKAISENLEIQITNIGRVFGPKWAACSLRSVKAVWQAYPALYKYFATDKNFSGMTARLANTNF